MSCEEDFNISDVKLQNESNCQLVSCMSQSGKRRRENP